MTTKPRENGRRPIDRILAPAFAQGVADLDLAELRERRALAEQEEVDLSYARRLLQGRVDLLRSQQQSLAGAGSSGQRSDADLARALAAILSDGGPRSVNGLGRHLAVDPSRVGEHRRAAEQAVSDLAASDPSPDVVARAIEELNRLEHDVSENRHRVQEVMDVLTAEIARRYRTGEARVEDVLAVE